MNFIFSLIIQKDKILNTTHKTNLSLGCVVFLVDFDTAKKEINKKI